MFDVNKLSDFIEQLEKLKEAHNLLEKIWGDVGPYGNDKGSWDNMKKLQEYFNFVDSE